MSKIRTLVGGGQIFFCPGCKSTHALNSSPTGPRWTYNGDPVRPTFSPSILATLRWSESDPDEKDEVCHSFVRDGNIQFLGDCTHDLADKTVAVPEWPYAPGTYRDIMDDA